MKTVTADDIDKLHEEDKQQPRPDMAFPDPAEECHLEEPPRPNRSRHLYARRPALYSYDYMPGSLLEHWVVRTVLTAFVILVVAVVAGMIGGGR